MSEKRKVRLKVTFWVTYEVPDDWDDDMVRFHVNESSFCRDTLLQKRLEFSQSEDGFCTCNDPDVEIVPLVDPEQGTLNT